MNWLFGSPEEQFRDRVEFRLDLILNALHRVLDKENKLMGLGEDLTAEVAEIKGVAESAEAAIAKILAKLEQANAISPEAVQAAIDDLKATQSGLAAAVATVPA